MAETLTPIVGQTHDLTVTDPDGNESGFRLFTPDEQPRLLIQREPTLAPQQFTGHVNPTSQKPDIDLVWSISSFHRGGLSFRWTPENEAEYNEANGVDAHTPGELSLANKMSSTSESFVIVPDAGMESGSIGDWEGPGAGTVTVKSDDPRTGSFHLSYKSNVPGGSGQSDGVLPLANPTAYQSRAITFNAWVRFFENSNGGNPGAKIAIFEDTGSGWGTAGTGDTLTTGSSYTFHTVTATVSASATKVGVGFRGDTSGSLGDATEWYVDDMFAFVNDAIPRSAVEYKDGFYAAIGGAVMKWNETNDTFEVVHIPASGSNVNGLGVSAVDNTMIAGYGTGDTYSYSTDGSSWTSGKTGPHGPYVTVADRIWGVKNDNTVSSADDVQTPSWTDYTDIGQESRAITGIYAVNDVPVIGKEDGLYVYNRAANDFSGADRFRNILPGWQVAPHPDNFARGVTLFGWLYLATRRGVIRFDGFNAPEDVSHQFGGPQLDDFGGRIRAFAIDANLGYALMDTPESDDTVDKTTWLLSFDEFFDRTTDQNTFSVHPLHRLSIGDLRLASAFYNQTNTHLYIFGRVLISGSTYAPIVVRMLLTDRHSSASRDTAQDFGTEVPADDEQSITTQYWDGLFPAATKVFKTLNLRVEEANNNKSIVVAFQIDEDTSWTTLGTITSNGLITLNFSGVALAKRSGKRIRFRFTLSTDSSTATPRVLMPIELHTTFRPERLRTYQFSVLVADNLPLLNHGTDPRSAEDVRTELDGYLDDDWPVTLKENESGKPGASPTSHSVFVRDVRFWKALEQRSGPRNPIWVYTIDAVEAKLS